MEGSKTPKEESCVSIKGRLHFPVTSYDVPSPIWLAKAIL